MKFAKTGAKVYAFEPDEVAFQELEKNVAEIRNVECIKAAVSSADGQTKLYHRSDRTYDELLSTQGSSLESSKENVDDASFQIVDTIDLAKFIRGLSRRISCIKMDIEGHEAAVLEHLLDSGSLENVDVILVETHERKVPGLAPRLNELKSRVSEIEHLRVDWNWI
jgi:FkbM family methyltransferase